MQKVRSTLLSWPVLVFVAYCLIGLVFLGLGYVSTGDGATVIRSVVVAVALFILSGFGAIAVLGIEEDWWNEFREMNAALLVAALCQFVLLPGAWFLGSSLN